MISIRQGDALEVLRQLPAASAHSLVTDPPAGIGFMDRSWDSDRGGRAQWVAWLAEILAECRRVLRPGAHALVWALPRTAHWTATALEDAGFEVRDVVVHLFGTGFPKSLDISQQLDKRGDEQFTATRRATILRVTEWIREARDRAGLTNRDIDAWFGTNGMAGHWTSSKSQPHVPTADQWPVLLEILGCGAPPDEIRAAVDEWLRIKGQPAPTWSAREVLGRHEKAAPGQLWRQNYGGRANLAPKELRPIPASGAAARWLGWGTALKPAAEHWILARAPLAGTIAGNVLGHGCGALNIDGCRIGRGALLSEPGRWPANVVLSGDAPGLIDAHSAEASRFFYCAKASRAERGAGNRHPTVKPLELMRWLVRLVTPPGGTVLDPFAGSGSTVLAALTEGCFDCIAIEREGEYASIALQRARTIDPLFHDVPAPGGRTPAGEGS